MSYSARQAKALSGFTPHSLKGFASAGMMKAIAKPADEYLTLYAELHDLRVALNGLHEAAANLDQLAAFKDTDGELKLAQAEARALYHIILARAERLKAEEKALVQQQRENYLASTPFKIGTMVAYRKLEKSPRYDDREQSNEIGRGVIRDYVIDPHSSEAFAVVDGNIVPTIALHDVDAATRLGALADEEEKLLGGYKPIDPSGAAAPIFFHPSFGGRVPEDDNPDDYIAPPVEVGPTTVEPTATVVEPEDDDES